MAGLREPPRGALAVLVVASACASVPPPAPPPAPETLKSTALLAAMDWPAAGDEAFADLRTYLMAPTTNPPGDEKAGALVLQELLRRDGLEAELWPVGADSLEATSRVNLVARLRPDDDAAPATERPGPLCLVSHIDVVTAEPGRWPADKGPHAGAVSRDPGGDDVLWGRGALDMKGMGLLEVEVLRWLKRLQTSAGLKLAREVIVLAVADEEVASLGMIDAVERHWDALGCSHAINEGGLGIKDALLPGQTAFTVSVGEKGVLWLRLKAEGIPGHGSTPVPGRSPGKLLEAMSRIARRADAPRVHPALYELLAAAGREAGGVEGFVLERPALVDALVMDRLLAQPLTRAITNDTVNLTGFAGAQQPNVVPSEVYAQYDVRLLPGTTPDAVIAELQGLVADIPGVSIETIDFQPAAVSDWDDPLYRALSHHAVDVARRHGDERVVVGPVISPGFTDSIFLRKKGVRAYGFVPFVITAEEANTMHGDGERVSKKNVTRGLETLLRAVVDVSAR